MANESIPQNPKTRTIKNPKAIQSKSRSHEVTPQGDDVFTVISGTSGEAYTVNIYEQGGTCTCPWQTKRQSATFSGCSHVVAVYNHIAEQAGRVVSVWTSEEDAKRQHRPQLSIGDGVTLTARLAPSPIIWTIQSQKQDQARVLIPA